ncbi:hypothetical protein DFH11DRAFT_1220280 [Phellopilus nigrolimitatus]|nr:hypothetical protein DFH11DRAFT_1220280 [Phellopilus nigrolimitatus]
MTCLFRPIFTLLATVTFALLVLPPGVRAPLSRQLLGLENYSVFSLDANTFRITGAFSVRRIVAPSPEMLFNIPAPTRLAQSRSLSASPHYFSLDHVPPERLLSTTLAHMQIPSHTTAAKHATPEKLSTPLLSAVTGGVILLFLAISILLYCCVHRRSEKRRRIEIAAEGTNADLEKQRRWPNTTEFAGDPPKEQGASPIPVFEFSPPSPTWRPALPSLAFVTGTHGVPSTDTTASKKDREGRRGNVPGSWSRGISDNGAPAAVAALPRIHAPTPVRAAPPLPQFAPQTYCAPAYSRRSRVMPVITPSAVPTRLVPERLCPVDVPRIQIHLAQETSNQVSRIPATRSALPPASGAPPSNTPYAISNLSTSGVGTARNDSKKSHRPISGLGISTVDLAARRTPSLSAKSSSADLGGERLPATLSTSSHTSCSQSDVRIGTSRDAPPAKSATHSPEEDVRLAYTISGSTIKSESCNTLRGTTAEERVERTKEIVLESRTMKPKVKPRVANEQTRAVPSTVHDTQSRTIASEEINSTAKKVEEKLKAGGARRRTPTAHTILVANKPTSVNSAALAELSSLKDSDYGPSSLDCAAIVADISAPRSPLTRSVSSKQSNLSKRQGLGAGTIDDSTKSELHAMRSLGSESFDSLIAYLAETVEPGEARPPSFAPPLPTSLTKTKVSAKNTAQKVSEQEQPAPAAPDAQSRDVMTREDTAHVDTESYETWLGSLNASPSILRLAHVDVDKDGDCRVGRSRSRSASQGASKGNRTMEGQSKYYSETRAQCENDQDADAEFARDGVQRGRNSEKKDNAPPPARVRVGMHVRALRARSVALKPESQHKDELGFGLSNQPVRNGHSTARDVPSSAHSIRPLSVKKSTSSPALRDEQTHNSSMSSPDFTSVLPSFSIPSSATILFATFPSNEVTLDDARSSSRRSLSSAQGQASSKGFVSASTSAVSYIARCATTPHNKSAAVLSLLSPTPSASSMHRLSTDSTSSMGSSMIGRRVDWCHESLTPRFNHLRAVFEGRFEDPPPLPTHGLEGISERPSTGTPGHSGHRTMILPSFGAWEENEQAKPIPNPATTRFQIHSNDRTPCAENSARGELVVLDRGRIFPSASNIGVADDRIRRGDNSNEKAKPSSGEKVFDSSRIANGR